MLAGSQHESKSHLISLGPNKLQMYTVKAKLSTNQHRKKVNCLCTCRWEKKEKRQNSCAEEDSKLALQRLCRNSRDNQADVFYTYSSHQDSYQEHVSKRFIEPAVDTCFKGAPTRCYIGYITTILVYSVTPACNHGLIPMAEHFNCN